MRTGRPKGGWRLAAGAFDAAFHEHPAEKANGNQQDAVADGADVVPLLGDEFAVKRHVLAEGGVGVVQHGMSRKETVTFERTNLQKPRSCGEPMPGIHSLAGASGRLGAIQAAQSLPAEAIPGVGC